MKENLLKYTSYLSWAVAIVSICLLVFCRGCGSKEEPQIIEKVDTVVVTKIDTIKIKKDSIIYKTKTVLDTLYVHDTILIREQKEYEDSLSHIWISGIEAEIDSIHYTIPEKTVTITKEINKIEKKKTGWSLIVGPYVGYGIGLDNKTVIAAPEIGIGVSVGWGVILK